MKMLVVLVALALASPAFVQAETAEKSAAVVAAPDASLPAKTKGKSKSRSKRNTGAMAPTTETTTAPTLTASVTEAVKVPSVRSALRRGLEFTGSYSLAQDLKGMVSVSGVGSGDYSVTPGGAPALGLRFINVQEKMAAFSMGGYLELSRSADDIKTTINGTEVRPNNGGATSVAFFALEPNVTYGFSNKVYGLGGLNYTLPFASNLAGTVNGALGVQAGLGYNIDNSINVEALYRTINMSLAGGNLSDGSAKLWGLLLRGSYQFF